MKSEKQIKEMINAMEFTKEGCGSFTQGDIENKIMMLKWVLE